ncbi:MAG: bifunctional hydroxymethylpyrimidine kinase/phosphomethylpyrimidine kinase [Lawsonibacter sp.]
MIINDMPGYGKVALAAMLPILSNMGHSVYNLPTALVSNTLDYGTFSILDTTDYMVKAIAAWKKLGFSFDCITTGFLASAEQVDIIRDFIASQKKEGLLVMTDPIMGDDGKLYNGVTEETVENMRRLIGVADVIVPNLTEAEFLYRHVPGAGGPRPPCRPGRWWTGLLDLRPTIGGGHQRLYGGDWPPCGLGL